MMDTGSSIGRWRALIKNKSWRILSYFDTFFESFFLVPLFQDFIVYACKIKILIFRKLSNHRILKRDAKIKIYH